MPPHATQAMTPDRLPYTSVLAALDLEQGALIAVAGAGGKSTLAHRLAGEGTSRGLRTIVSATTRLGASAARAASLTLEDTAPRRGDSAADARIAGLLGAHTCLAVAGPRQGPERWTGLPPERVAALAGLCDLLVVETDGARGRLLKLPAAHEPVVPSTTELLLVVAGLDVLGRPLDAAHVHRLELVLACLGSRPGAPIDEGALVRVLLDEEGYLARVPPGARAAVFLNARDGDAAQAEAAARLAERLLTRYDLVLAGSAQAGPVRAWRRP